MTTSPTLDSPRAPEQHPEPVSGVRRHHWWRWVAGVLAVLLVVFVAAGWYFSGRIRSGALDAAPAPAMPAYDDVRIQALNGDSVTLAKGPDAPYNFDAAATYTMAWDGGWGRVGPATTNADGTVTRSLSVVKGDPPTAGQLAAQDRAAWLGDPTMGFKDSSGRALLVDEVMVGDNPAWYFPAADQSTDTMAIVVHGQNGTRNNMLRAVPTAHGAGLPVLDITYRNDLGAAPDPSGQLQYGQAEWRDLDAAVTWARSQGAQHVVLIGESMGGAVVAAFLEESDQPDVVSKVVLDAPMLSLGETITWNARDAMPVVGGAVPAPVIWAAEQITSLRDGIDWSKVDYLDDTAWLRVPTLVIHGTADERVPVTVARSVKAAAPSLVTLEEFTGAQHTEAWNSDPGRYDQLLESWLSTST